MTKTLNYSFTDYSEYDPGRGGSTPTYNFIVEGTTLEVSVDDDSYNQECPVTREEAMVLLTDHRQELACKLVEIDKFLAVANTTTKYVTKDNIDDYEEDDDE